MTQELDVARNVYLDLDEQGVVRGLLHFNEPFASAASTPQLVAADYLESFSDLLGVEAAQLAQLGLSPGTTITKDGVEYRFLLESSRKGSRRLPTSRRPSPFRSGRPAWPCRSRPTLSGC